jgi:hypothetical protein
VVYRRNIDVGARCIDDDALPHRESVGLSVADSSLRKSGRQERDYRNPEESVNHSFRLFVSVTKTRRTD